MDGDAMVIFHKGTNLLTFWIGLCKLVKMRPWRLAPSMPLHTHTKRTRPVR